MDAFEWGPAEVSYPDWKGTAQIDEKMTGDESMYSITGIDEDEWQIIGLDFGGGESGFHNLRVIVVPEGTDLDANRVEAKMIQVHDVDPLDFLRRVIHLFDMRFRIRRLESSEIVITSFGDAPPQE